MRIKTLIPQIQKTWRATILLFILLSTCVYGINSVQAATSSATPNTKVLTVNRAIAAWPTNVPAGEKRPVIVFLPGWGGVGAVNASVSSQNLILVNEGYVTLAIGFDSSSEWISDIEVKTKQGLNKLCTDSAIPANCDAITLIGESYGGAQNYWVIEYIRSNGYDGGTGSTGKALGFLSEDAGYGAPGYTTDPNTGAYTRTGLADTSSYSVAMIQNLGDTTFPVDECTWGNCGARVLSNAHLAQGDTNVFSICPPAGEHGTRGFSNWNAWVISAIKTIIHITGHVPTFTGYTSPTLLVDNSCIDNAPSSFVSDAAKDGYILETSETSGKGGTMDASASTLNLGDDSANRQYRAILSFDTTSLPDNAVISSVTLKIKYASKTGYLPFNTLGNLLVDIRNGSFSNNSTLQLNDFKALAGKNNVLAFTNAKVNNWYSASLAAEDFPYINITGITQFRLRFAIDDNNNSIPNLLKIYSSNASAVNRPQLLVQYSTP